MRRTYGKMPPPGEHTDKLDEDKRKRPAAGNAAAREEDEPARLQHAIGNKAMRKLAQSVAVSGSGPLLPREPKFARYARWLFPHVEAGGRQDLLRRFYALTMAQKRAALLNTLGRPALQSERYTLDLDGFDRSVRGVKHVELRKGEAEKEADERERGAAQAERSFNPSGLLHPYREILLWLNYKAIKQGQAALMLRFEKLSAAQKQLAMHRMLRFRSLSVRTFTREMTLTLLEREWVDWAAVRDGLRMAERFGPGRSQGAGASGTDTESPAHAGQMREGEGEEIDAGGLPSALLSLLGLAGGEDAEQGQAGAQPAGGQGEEPKSGRDNKRPQDKAGSGPEEVRSGEAGLAMLSGRSGEYWMHLLLGIKGSLAVLAIVERYRSGSPDKESVVDRHLGIGSYPPDRRKKQRAKRLRAAGFRSVADCFAFVMKGFAAFLARGAAAGKDKAFKRALKLLDIPEGTEEQRAAELISKRLG
ncbi:hypothetical protein [Paenibacillus sp. 1P07SE]|uniref:hypothetical protein n=1 Tax=Paenibacillus sp. 1P07SE TaxID=3132209 RepID=UPI0039A78643